MRFLTVAILSFSLTANAAEPGRKREVPLVKKAKVSRVKAFWRGAGAFGVGMLMSDPYTEVLPAKRVQPSKRR